MQELAFYQVDAFTERRFGGNPAGVVPLARWFPDAVMQSIAAENNVAETAFFVPEGDRYGLRWFTPAVEVDLCGHATLATGFVIANFLAPGKTAMGFGTRSGALSVHREGDLFTLDFPVLPTAAVGDPPDMTRALGRRPSAVRAGRHWLAIFDRESDLRDLEPDMPAIAALGRDGVIATAPGSDRDYVCRYFVPQAGIPEDPATGSAQCTLMPYWAARLGRARLTGRQISARVGEFRCELKGDRVAIAGHAVCYLKGSIFVE
jgi:PhzF family phenazine biosynthesis protein